MVKQLLRQSVGIDVSQKKIDVSLGRMDGKGVTEVYLYKQFTNNEKGFMSMLVWFKKNTLAEVASRFVMEATGVYHEHLAHFLWENNHFVSVVVPNKVSNFFKTREVKTVTDKTMAETIAMFGLHSELSNWAPAAAVYRDLRQITREREQLVEERTMVKNQLHAENAQAYPNKNSLVRVMDRIRMINKQIKQIMDEIKQITLNDEELAATTGLITTITGVGLLTVATILGETDSFALIKNKRQLASYAGLDVIEKESGTSIKAKTRISKKGNKHVRKAMHMPALSAIVHDKVCKDAYIRIVARTGIKMKGVVAIQRRLLEMIYTIYTTKKPYDPDYVCKQVKRKQEKEEEKKRATQIELLAAQAGI